MPERGHIACYVHLSQLDKRARKTPWEAVLRSDVPVRVEASCRRSKIYHAGAAAQRVETAIRESFGAPVVEDAAITVRVRIEDNVCTLSVDTSGALLHRRRREGLSASAARLLYALAFARRLFRARAASVRFSQLIWTTAAHGYEAL